MRCKFQILVRKPNRKRHLAEQDIEGRIILKQMLEKVDGFGDWIHLAQNRDQ
jgi:hypothetical protein